MPPVILAGGLPFVGVAGIAAAAVVTPPSVTATAACPVKPASPRLARVCAEAAAFLEALRDAAARLRQRRDVALSLSGAEECAALAAGLYTPLLRPVGAGRVEITLASRPDEEGRIAAGLRRPELLNLYQRLLREYEGLLSQVSAPPPAARGGAWYRARAASPTAGPSESGFADAAAEASREDEDRLAGRLEAANAVWAALQPAANDWYARPEALHDLERAVERLPNGVVPLLLLAEAQLQHDLPQQSIAACTAALRLAPDLSRARYVRALAHWRLQQLALAEDDLSVSLTGWHGRAPQGAERAQRLRARGAVRLSRDDTAGMCADFMDACVLGDCEGLVAVRARGLCLPATTHQAPDANNGAQEGAPSALQAVPPLGDAPGFLQNKSEPAAPTRAAATRDTKEKP